MTVHTEIRAGRTDEVAAHCPAAAIGHQVGRLRARLNELDDAGLGLERPHDAEIRQIHDRIDCLAAQLEWVEARSLEGLFAQILQLRVQAENWGSLDGPDRERGQAGFDRLCFLVQTGFPRLTGMYAAPFSPREFTCEPHGFRAAREISGPGPSGG